MWCLPRQTLRAPAAAAAHRGRGELAAARPGVRPRVDGRCPRVRSLCLCSSKTRKSHTGTRQTLAYTHISHGQYLRPYFPIFSYKIRHSVFPRGLVGRWVEQGQLLSGRRRVRVGAQPSQLRDMISKSTPTGRIQVLIASDSTTLRIRLRVVEYG